MEPEEIDDLIERYVLHRLNPVERQDFEKILLAHTEWCDKLKMHQALTTALDPERKSFRNKIEEINKMTQVDPNRSKLITFKILSIAAGVLILLSAGLFFLLSKSSTTSDDLYSAYMLTPSSLSPDLIPIRGQDQSIRLSLTDSILIAADRKYMNGDFNEAIAILKYTSVTPSDKAIFQLGLLELIQGHPQDALNYFDRSGYDRDELAWYKALTYLKLNNKEACRLQLNKINPASRWSIKSKELALKLN